MVEYNTAMVEVMDDTSWLQYGDVETMETICMILRSIVSFVCSLLFISRVLSVHNFFFELMKKVKSN